MENQQNGKTKYFEYFSEIEQTFIKLRGRNLLLSPGDWALIETWQERGIPVEVVCKALEKCFARKHNPQDIKSLKYCQHQVDEDFRNQ